MKRFFLLVFVVGLLTLFSGVPVDAKECQFDFFYQRIEKVVQINNPEPKGWWDKTKSFVKGVGNTIARTWEKEVTRKFFPGEGSKTWYSKQDPNTAYTVSRHKVRDEAHLLELMGVKSESQLTDGQKALMASFRMSQSQAIKNRIPYGKQSKIRVILSDTTGFDDKNTFPDVEKDFWPYSNGSLIQLSSNGYNYPNSEDDARSTFLHEYAHSMDGTVKEFFNPYGKDGSHYCDEKTGKRAAFIEGWAEFNEMLEFPMERSRIISSVNSQIRIESKKKAGEYEFVDPKGSDISGLDLLNVEGVNACILFRMASEIPDGQKKVFEAFVASNGWFNNLRDLVKAFLRKNPGELAKVGTIIDEATYGKLTDSQLQEFIGDSAASTAFLKTRKTKLIPGTVPSKAPAATKTSGGANVIGLQGNPYSEK